MLLAATRAAGQQAAPPEPVFQAGTRLVEVEVVVRNHPVRPPGFGGALRYVFDTGPPFGPPGVLAKGLTKYDFTLLDQATAQPIAVFRADSTGGHSGDAKPIALAPGAVSNRHDSRGQPLNGATAVLVDLLNTPFEDTEYARLGLKEFLRTLGETDSRIALYSLGRELHTLHHSDDLGPALRDFGDIMGIDGGEEAAAELHGRITFQAVQRIVERLSGMPGRRNLVWLANIAQVPPRLMAMIQRANIVLYPVMVRCSPRMAPCGFEVPESEYAKGMGAATGGRGFSDARDLVFAVRAAEEDLGSAYVLGYYPTEDMLDGKYHNITVRARNRDLVLHYRSGYLATKVAVPTAGPSPDQLFTGQADSAGIGLSALATPAAQHPGFYDVRVTVDLRDIHLERKDGRFTGAFELSVPNPLDKGTVKTGTVAVDLTDEQFAAALENGLPVFITGAKADMGEIRVVVRDRANGIAGSLRVPVARL
jgi:VWFA-related protein